MDHGRDCATLQLRMRDEDLCKREVGRHGMHDCICVVGF